MADTDGRSSGAGGVARAGGPFSALTVVDLSTTPAGAITTQLLADGGAQVLMVERPGGGRLRADPGWPALGRGKHSVVLDLAEVADRSTLHDLVARADVVVDTFRPGTAERLGADSATLARINPAAVTASISGWGLGGPWKDLKGYEGMVMAKLGMFHSKRRMVTRPGPAFITVPFATFGAAHSALQGILAALIERQVSGIGQHVDADLLRGACLYDTWNWFLDLIGQRWPDAYQVTEAYSPEGEPLQALTYPLLVAPTSDGHWLQFAQVQPRLFAAMLEEFELTALLGDPKWKGLPVLPTQELRTELWEIMIAKVGERTLEEWQRVFDTNPNLNAEVFRAGPGVLEHPQLVHDGRVAIAHDPQLGPVTQPSTLVHVDERPLGPPGPAPALGDDGGVAAAMLADVAHPPATETPGAAPARLPLEGITILEFAVMFAAPFGSTILTDLGARVIKVESLEGDAIRTIMPFPESGGARVMQGKESIAVDLNTDEGRAVVHELARRADVVLQGFRAGAAARAGVDAATLQALNPDLVYVNAPGYGTGGPYGAKPAYAPSIGAAGGVALTDAPSAATATGSMAEIKRAALRLANANAVSSLQCDGIAAVGVATTIMVGLAARALGRPLGPLTATMIATTSHALVSQVVDYEGRPETPTVDDEGYGLGARYRLYETADGWVFLAAPAAAEWPALAASLEPWCDLGADTRFADEDGRIAHDAGLAAELGRVFALRAAADWERDLAAAGVGCVVVYEGNPELRLQLDPALAAEYGAPAHSPIFDDHLRMGPAVRFSRSLTQALGGCTVGQHTDAILDEIGYTPEAVSDLRSRKLVG